jgi:ATP-dependent helicase Lhr and Lhr-like helicase
MILPSVDYSKALKSLEQWFNKKQWTIFDFQKEVWENVLQGKSGLLNSPTGSGKTYALFFPQIIKELHRKQNANEPKPEKSVKKDGFNIDNYPLNKPTKKHRLKLLWITPLRALAKDLVKSMQEASDIFELNWTIEQRTGDISSAAKQKQQKSMPEVLVITPESLHVLLAQRNNHLYFEQLECIVCDEWHELMGSKRGILAQFAISLIKEYQPKCTIWGISATIGNLEEALEALIPKERNKSNSSEIDLIENSNAVIIKNSNKISLRINSLIPDEIESFPWSGHIGLKLIPQVNALISQSQTSLVFTNTRAQCELWYQNLLNFNPDLAGQIAMHHGSIDGDIRTWIEDALKEGRLKVVVCTSTLDLGVDFYPVDSVIQIGSPKGIARFLQRAGRSGHRPNATSTITLVPTHAIELIEAAAIEMAVENGIMESRKPFFNTTDLLLQFLTTMAVGEGLFPELAWKVVRQIYAFKNLTKESFNSLLHFLLTGGNALKTYDEYQKLIPGENNSLIIANKTLALRHRLSIGAILSDTSIRVRFMSGGSLGSIEEYFISSLNFGDSFWFAGRCLELVQIKDNTAYVRPSKTNKGIVASWMGGRMPLSTQLSEVLQHVIPNWEDLQETYPVLQAVNHILEIQQKWSVLPGEKSLVFEKNRSREGFHVFCYPIEGRLAHEGLASLFALRISRIKPITFSIAMNDYGFELLSDQEIPLEEALENGLLSQENLEEDVFESINQTDLVKRKFREIAQLGGLLFMGYPGKLKKDRHLQSSSGLLYEVIKKYDSENPLIKQAEHEVLYNQLELDRLIRVFSSLKNREVVITTPEKFTPFAFPIFTDRLREKLSSEKLDDRIRKMQIQLTKAASKR